MTIRHKHVTGIITDWTVQSVPHGLVVVGLMHLDNQNRFDDGSPITTSVIERIVPIGNTYLCYSRNSLYVLA